MYSGEPWIAIVTALFAIFALASAAETSATVKLLTLGIKEIITGAIIVAIKNNAILL